MRCPSSFLLAHIREPSCLLLVPELIDEELYLEVGRGAGGGPLPRPPIGRLRLSSPRVGGSRSPGPARLGSSLFSDSVSEAVDRSEMGPEEHSRVQTGSLTLPQDPSQSPGWKTLALTPKSPSQPLLHLLHHPFLKLPPRLLPPTHPTTARLPLTTGRTAWPPAPAPAPVAAPIGSCGVEGGGGALIGGVASLVAATAAPPTPRRAKAQPNLPKLFINLQPLQAKLLHLLVGEKMEKNKEGGISIRSMNSLFFLLLCPDCPYGSELSGMQEGLKQGKFWAPTPQPQFST